MGVPQETDRRDRDSGEGSSEIGENLSFFLEKSPYPVAVTDIHGVLLEVNEQWTRLFGFSKNEAIGKTNANLGISRDTGNVQRLLSLLKSTGSIHDEEISLFTRSGEERTVLGSLELVSFNGTMYILSSLYDITERRRSEEALRRSEERYRIISDFTQDWEFWIDPDGKFVYISPSADQILGRPARTYSDIHQFLREVVHPEDLSARLAHLQDELAGKGSSELEFRIVRPGGEVRWIHHVCRPIRDAGGKFLGTRGSNRDITERRQSEDALRRSEEKYRIIFETANEGIWIHDAERKTVLVNQRMADMLGYTVGEILGRTPIDFLSEGQEPVRQKTLDTLKTGISTTQEFRFRRKDGSDLWVISSASPVLDGKGDLFQTISLLTDITEWKRAEGALRESEERFRIIAETSPVLLSVSSLNDGTVLFVNPAYEQAFGFDQGEFVGKKAVNIYYNDADREAIVSILKKEGEIRNRTVQVRRRDGTPFWVESSVTRIRFDGTDAMLGASVDITERKRVEEALRESQATTVSILEGIADTFYSLNEEWRFTVVNPAAEKAPFGRPASELLGKVIWNLYPKLVGTLIHRHYLDAAKNHSLEHYEAQSPLNSRWYEVFMQGRRGGVDVYMRDITERRQAEEALRKARDDLEIQVQERTTALKQALSYNRNLIEASPDPLVTIRADGTIGDINAATVRATGVSRQGLIGTDFSNYFTDPEKAKAGYEAVFRDGSVRDYALGLRHRDGRITPVLYNATIFYDALGTVAGVFAAARDVSSLKEAEMKLTQAHTETRLERQRLYDVLETLPIYVCLLDKDYRMPFANRYFRETFGHSLVRPCYEFLFNRTSPCENCDTYTVMKTRAPHHWFWTGPNGRNYDIYDFPFLDVDGSFLVLEMGIDITEQRKAEEALRKANEILEQRVSERTAELAGSNEELLAANEGLGAAHEELNQTVKELKKSEELLRQKAGELTEALAEKEMLLSEIHHRVKNNLTAFISLLSLEGSYEESEAGKQLKKDLQNRARSMALIHETLYRTRKFSHVDMGIYLTTLVSQITTTYTTRRDVHIEVHADGEILDLGRATPCGLIINELVTNSFKYAFPRGFDCAAIRNSPCTISVALKSEDSMYRLTVSDNGTGLPEGINLSTAKTLGLKLVNFLARHQLQATTLVDTSAGTSIEFRFRKDPGFS